MTNKINQALENYKNKKEQPKSIRILVNEIVTPVYGLSHGSSLCTISQREVAVFGGVCVVLYNPIYEQLQRDVGKPYIKDVIVALAKKAKNKYIKDLQDRADESINEGVNLANKDPNLEGKRMCNKFTLASIEQIKSNKSLGWLIGSFWSKLTVDAALHEIRKKSEE